MLQVYTEFLYYYHALSRARTNRGGARIDSSNSASFEKRQRGVPRFRLDPGSTTMSTTADLRSGLVIHGPQSENSQFCGKQNQNSESSVISILIDSESEFYINVLRSRNVYLKVEPYVHVQCTAVQLNCN